MENEIQDNQGKEIPPPGIAEVESKIESSNKQLNTEKLGFKKKSVKNSNNLTKNKRERQKNNQDDFDKLSKVNTAKKDKNFLKEDDETKNSKTGSLEQITESFKKIVRPREKTFVNNEYCEFCKNGGDIILCDGCPLSFHFSCIGLSQEEIPKGKWYCGNCPLQKKIKSTNHTFLPPLVENINDTLTEMIRIEEEKKKNRKLGLSTEGNVHDNSLFKNFEDKNCFPPEIKNINININNNNNTTLAHNSNYNINGIPSQNPYLSYPTFPFQFDLNSNNYFKALEKDLAANVFSQEKKSNPLQFPDFLNTNGINFNNNFFNYLTSNNLINQSNLNNSNIIVKNFMENLSKMNYINKNQPLLKNNNVSLGENLNKIKDQLQDTDVKQSIANPFVPSVQQNNFKTESKIVERNDNGISNTTSENLLEASMKAVNFNSFIQNNLQNQQQQSTAYKNNLLNQAQPIKTENTNYNNNNNNNPKLDYILMQKFLNDSKCDKSTKPILNSSMNLDTLGINLMNIGKNNTPVQKGNPFQGYPNPTHFNNLQVMMNLINNGQIQQANNNMQNMMFNLARNPANMNPLLINNFKNMVQAQINQPKSVPNYEFEPQVNVRSIRYPVEDKLLYDNPSYYGLTFEALRKKEPKEQLIPAIILGKILKIWDFVITFKDFLRVSDFSPEELYYSLKSNSDLEKLTLEIHISLLTVFMVHLNTLENQEFSSNKDLLMLKFCVETKSPRKFLKRCWIEMIKFMLNSKLFKLMMNSELDKISKKLIDLTPNEYIILSVEEKISILDFLINSIYETNQIKEIVKNELERKFELKREKNGLEYEYKNKELRKKELENSEKFQKAKIKIESLSKQIVCVEDNLLSRLISKQEGLKQKKELEIERERYLSLLKEFEDFDNIKTKIFARLDEIKKEINNMHYTTIKRMGNDGCRNEYYFFKNCNSKIFVKKQIENKGNLWYSYSSSEEILDLLSKLTDKGIKERTLINNIRKVFPKKMKFRKQKTQIKRGCNKDETESSIDSQYEYDSEDLKKNLKEWENLFGKSLNETRAVKTNKTVFQKIYESIFKIEEKLSEYLNQFDKEWEIATNREELKAFMKVNTDVKDFSHAFHFLLERFKNPYKINEFHDEENLPNDYKTNIYTNDGRIDIHKVDERRVLAPKVKLFSKEFDQLDAEKIFWNYIENNISSISNLFFAVYAFEGIINNFFRRRESTNKKYSQLSKEINETVVTQDKSIKEIKEKHQEKNDQIMIEKEQLKPIEEKEIVVTKVDNNYITPNITVEKQEIVPPVVKKKKKSSNDKFIINEVRKTRPKKLKWKETCYICNDFGDLICCEGCTSVVHLFCACLDKIPDKWYCEKCTKFRNKN